MKQRFFTITLVAAVSCFALCSVAPARTTCEVKHKSIIITMYIAFRGADESLTRRWTREILDVWNSPNGCQEYGQCKCPVYFLAQTVNLEKDEAIPEGWHWVDVEGGSALTPDGHSTIAYMGKTLPSPPAHGASVDGVWSTRTSALVNSNRRKGARFKDAAHEAGHMMGLPDYYNRKTGWQGKNLMGHTYGPHSKVTSELVSRIVETVTGKPYCPVCPPPSERPALEAVQVEGPVAGLSFEYYEGQFESLGELAELEPAKSGEAATFDLGLADRRDKFALVFTGYIRIPSEGCYRFFLHSDDGSQLFVGDRLVVDNDGCHEMLTRAGEVKLEAGLHPIKVSYFQVGGQQGLLVSYSGPDVAEQAIPASVLFRKPGSDNH
ncbi:MAG: PA14 domain-containing protein [Planctomycetota bacterium]|jgi:hypothetical protein